MTILQLLITKCFETLVCIYLEQCIFGFFASPSALHCKLPAVVPRSGDIHICIFPIFNIFLMRHEWIKPSVLPGSIKPAFPCDPWVWQVINERSIDHLTPPPPPPGTQMWGMRRGWKITVHQWILQPFYLPRGWGSLTSSNGRTNGGHGTG